MTASMENIIVVADIRAKHGHESDVRAALETAVQDVRSKDGCLLYRLHEDISAAGHFILYEIWRDIAAVDAHHASAQFKALLEASSAITEKAELFRLTKLAE